MRSQIMQSALTTMSATSSTKKVVMTTIDYCRGLFINIPKISGLAPIYFFKYNKFTMVLARIKSAQYWKIGMMTLYYGYWFSFHYDPHDQQHRLSLPFVKRWLWIWDLGEEYQMKTRPHLIFSFLSLDLKPSSIIPEDAPVSNTPYKTQTQWARNPL